ncbi:MAG: GlsB/YeaQ/YmgE family stress response membrane protein [Anaerolineales bacterium]
MTLVGFIILLVIAAIAGSLGMALTGYSRGGCLFSAIIGFLGAFVGMWVARQFGLPELIPITVQGETFPVVWSVIGSAILSLILGVLTRGRWS